MRSLEGVGMTGGSQLPLNLFENRRVFITGHTGFKGSWLAAWLHLLGAEVTGFALPPERDQDHFTQLNLARRIQHIEGDVRDASHLRKAMFKARPEFVFHLAAQPLVLRSYKDPKLTFDTNVGGSVNVLEAVRAVDTVRVLIYVTSDKCYRNDESSAGFCETDALGGHDPYSASKACAELVLASYQASYFEVTERRIAAASVRAGNVIGGGDWAENRIIPDCIRSLSASRPVSVRNPDAVRPWQHVVDPLSGYLQLAARLHGSTEYSGAWNFGPPAESHRTVKELVNAVMEAWGGGSVRTAMPGRYHEARNLHLNCDKARQYLGWRPVWNFEESVRHTVDWYQHAVSGSDVWRLTTWQLETYAATASRQSRDTASHGSAA